MNQGSGVLREGKRMAGEVLDAGMFWRGNLAQAVKRRDFRGTLWGVLALSFFLFLYVWQHMQVVKLSYKVQALRAEKRRLTNDYYFLQYKLRGINSLPRVEELARTKLGMVTPRTDQLVILEEGPGSAPGWFALWVEAMKGADKR
jgi:cell division protein FtsL